MANSTIDVTMNRRALRRTALCLCLAWLTTAGLAGAESHAARAVDGERPTGPGPREGGLASEAEAEEARATEDAEAFTPVLYVPPSRGRAVHSAAGGTRGSARAGDLELAVLAPNDHVALTTNAQPRLYWYVSERVDSRVDVTLIDEDAIDPLLELSLPTPIEPGIHTIDLGAHGLELEAGRVYSWHVAVVRDATRRSNDLLAEGFIERTGVTDALERALEQAEGRYGPYARSGIWYDALDALRAAIRDEPRDPALLLQEVALLEQAELGGVARYARAESR